VPSAVPGAGSPGLRPAALGPSGNPPRGRTRPDRPHRARRTGRSPRATSRNTTPAIVNQPSYAAPNARFLQVGVHDHHDPVLRQPRAAADQGEECPPPGGADEQRLEPALAAAGGENARDGGGGDEDGCGREVVDEKPGSVADRAGARRGPQSPTGGPVEVHGREKHGPGGADAGQPPRSPTPLGRVRGLQMRQVRRPDPSRLAGPSCLLVMMAMTAPPLRFGGVPRRCGKPAGGPAARASAERLWRIVLWWDLASAR